MTDQIGDKPWTDEDLAQLKNLVADGSPIELIAMALGRTEDDIRGIVAKASRWCRIFEALQNQSRIHYWGEPDGCTLSSLA